MAFNLVKSLLLMTSTLLLLSGCNPRLGTVPDYKAENLIGIPLSKNSKLQSSNEKDADKIVVFDKTIRKVHHFDLVTATHLGLYDVDQPDEEHYLIYSSGLKYFIDLTKKYLGVHSLNGEKSAGTVKFVGTPISATFDSKQGYLVVYDSHQSVMIYKINERGTILNSLISGPEIKNQGTIQAGDISAGGKLILSVRGNPQIQTGTGVDFLVSIDIEQNLNNQNTNEGLVFDKIDTALTEMSWIAPVVDAPNLVMIRSAGKISVMDLTTKAISSLPTDDWVVEKYSKTKDAHIVLRKSYDFYSTLNGNVERRIYFVEGGVLKSKTLTKTFNFILNSHLDLKRGQWNVTKANAVKEHDLYNSFNGLLEGRSFTRIRMKDLLSIVETQIDDKATVEMANDYLFSLFPSPMGFATRTDIETNKTSTIKNFNIKYMK